MVTPVFRFAPSPNGYLHLGHALSALLNFDMACARGGRFLLRIEDIDEARCRPEYEQAIYEDLAWLGIAWDEPVRRQSEHFENYGAALARLDLQQLLYPSFESRAEIAALVAAQGAEWPHDPDGAPLYPGDGRSMAATERGRRLAAGGPHALRLDMAAAIGRAGALSWTETGLGPSGEAIRGDTTSDETNGESSVVPAAPDGWGDVVLARKETPTSYHLSVVIDDALQGVTHVVRGWDLFHATSVHRVLQALLGLPAPIYHHHRLVCDAAAAKLSKSTQATGLRELRGQGATTADIRRMVGLG